MQQKNSKYFLKKILISKNERIENSPELNTYTYRVLVRNQNENCFYIESQKTTTLGKSEYLKFYGDYFTSLIVSIFFTKFLDFDRKISLYLKA